MSLFRQILVLVFLAGMAYGGYVAYGRLMQGPSVTSDNAQHRSNAIPVEVAAAKTQELTTTVEAVGTTHALKSVEIQSEAAGLVKSIHFTAGDHVKKGDVLAELDSDIQRADVAEAKAALTQAQLQLERARTLRTSNIMAKATVDQLVAAEAAAQATLAKAERRLADRTITAPFDGVVGINRVDAGARITDSTIITTLDDISSVEIEFSVAERMFGSTRRGQRVEATTAAYPHRTFVGKISEIDSRIDPVSRSFKVRALVPNEDGALRPGMFMHVTVVLESTEALVVPEEAVIAEASSAYVYVVDKGKAERRRVTIGRREPGIAEILTGLAPQTRVVTRGTGKLRDGAAVEVVEATAAVKP